MSAAIRKVTYWSMTVHGNGRLVDPIPILQDLPRGVKHSILDGIGRAIVVELAPTNTGELFGMVQHASDANQDGMQRKTSGASAHFAIFRDGVLAFESTNAGIKPATLAWYIERKMNKTVARVDTKPLEVPEAEQAIFRFEEVRRMRFSMRRSGVATLRDLSPTLHEAFEAAAKCTDAPCIEMAFLPHPHDKVTDIRVDFLGRVAGWIQVPANRESVVEFSIRGKDRFTRRVVTLDLMAPRLAHFQPLPSRSVASREQYPGQVLEVMRSGYVQNRAVILAAMGRLESQSPAAVGLRENDVAIARSP